MKTRNLFLSIVLLCICFVANANNKKSKALFTSNAVITDVDTTLSFFIPEEDASVYIYVSDKSDNVFQKVKVYQRGNGVIVCDKTGLAKGDYFYTLFVDGEVVDKQKLSIKK